MAIIPAQVKKSVIIPLEQSYTPEPLSPEKAKAIKSQVEMALPAAKDAEQAEQVQLNVETSGVDAVRDSVAKQDFAERKAQKVNSLNDLLANPEADANIVAANIQDLANIRENKAALEERVVTNLLTPEDAYYADMVARVSNSNEFTRYKDRKVTEQMVSNVLASIQSKEEAENIFQEAWDATKELFSLEFLGRVTGKGFDYDEELRTKFKSIVRLPLEERAEAIKELKEDAENLQILGLNPQTTYDLLNRAVFNTKDEDAKQFAADFVESLFLLGGAAYSAGKGLRFINSAQTTNRALKEAALEGGKASDLAAELDLPLEETKFFSSVEEQIDGKMILKTDEEDFRSLAPEHQRLLRNNAARLQHLTEHSKAPEYTHQILERNLQEMNIGAPTQSIVKQTVDFDEGEFLLEYGNLQGKPFKTEAAAKKFAEDNNIPVESISQSKNSGYFIKSKIKDEEQLKFDVSQTSNRAWFINNIDNIVAPLFKSLGSQATDAAQGLLVEGRESFKNTILANLKNQKQLESWENVVNAGIDWDNGATSLPGKWLSKQEFKAEWNRLNPNTEYQDKFFTAYMGYRQLNDFTWVINNTAKVQAKRSQGLQGFKVEMPDGIVFDAEGKVEDISKVTDINGNKRHIMVFEDNLTKGLDDVDLPAHYYTASPGGLNPKEIERLSDTHNLVKLDKESVAALTDSGSPLTQPAEYVFLPKRMAPGEINPFQVPYRPGGRRIQDLTHVVKAGRFGTYSDGSKFRKTDKALFSAGSIKEAKEFAGKLDEAFKVAQDLTKGKITREAADDAFYKIGVHSKLAVDDVQDFIKWGISKNLIDEDIAELPIIQGLRDGEGVKIGQRFQLAEDFTDELLDFSDSVKLSKYRTNESLPSLSGGNTRLLDPVSALSRNLDQASQTAGFGAVRERALSVFQRSYAHHLENYDPKNPLSLLDATVDDAVTSPEIKRQIKNQQNYLKELLHHKTHADQTWQNAVEGAIDFIFEKTPGMEKGFNKLGAMYRGAKGLQKEGKGARRRVREALSKDPLSRAKSAMFHSKLGLFNPASFIQQFSHTVVVASIAGKVGFEAGMRGLVARSATRLDGEALEAFAAKGWERLGYTSKQDMIDYVTLFKDLGFHKVDQSAIIMNGMQGSQLTTSKVDGLLEAGKIFFNEGELASRITAYGSAYLKWQRKIGDINPKGLPVTHPDATKWISSETHRLMLGMNRSDLQFGLRGMMSVPTQFLSYPLRAITAMLPGTGKAFSKEEKVRMAAAYMMMAGTAGVPIAGMVGEWALDRYPDMTSDDVDKFLTNGVLDGLLYTLLDVDTNLSSRIGPGQLIPELWKKVTEGNFLEIMSGPGPATGWKALDAMMEAWRLHSIAGTLDIGTFSEAAWMGVSKQISTWNNIHKAIIAAETGKLVMSNRKAFAQMGTGEAILMVLGLPPQDYEDASKTFSKLAKNKDFKKQAGDNLHLLHEQWNDAYQANSKADMERIEHTIAAYMAGLDSLGVSLEVSQQVMRSQKNIDLMTTITQRAYELQTKGQDLGLGTILKKEQSEEK